MDPIREMALRILCILSVIAVLATVAFADTLVTSEGITITGRVVRQDANTVTIESSAAGTDIQQAFPRSKISSLSITPKPTGSAFLEVPLIGSVGQQISASAVEESFAAARRLSATHVVFLIDSPGGAIDEMERIIEVLSHHSDVKTIAFVKNANSAAALIAASCSTIIMHPMGRCGAAVPYMADKQGMPAAVSEKLTSAMRATARNAARVGGRPSELLIGMIDPDFELWAFERNGDILISLDKPETDGICIKPKGKVLTVTSEEAVRYGLAKGICKSMKEVGSMIGATSWQTCGEDGWEIMRRYAAAKADAQRQAAVEPAGPTPEQTRDAELASLKQRIRDTQSALAAFKKQMAGMDKQLEDDLQKAMDEYKASMATVAQGENKALKAQQARAEYNTSAERARAQDASRRSDMSNTIAILEQRIADDSLRLKQMQQ